jgi:hypothetical protein
VSGGELIFRTNVEQRDALGPRSDRGKLRIPPEIGVEH